MLSSTNYIIYKYYS